MKKFLENKLWKTIVDNMPIPAKDLLIYNEDNGLLMGKRRNKPAQNFYFVPGGRVFKNESKEDAINRISKEEIEFSIELKDFLSFGTYDHFYEDSIWNDSSVSTHYIVEAIFIKTQSSERFFNLDSQHSDLKWINESNVDKENVHKYSKKYLFDILEMKKNK